jgi:hypothetical protein
VAKRAPKNSAVAAGMGAGHPPAAAPHGGEPEAWTSSRLAAELGVDDAHVEDLQASICIAGEDFVDSASAAVFTASGVKKIRDRVHEEQLGAPPPPPPGYKAAPPAPVDYGPSPVHREDLRLTRVFRWSTNVLAETSAGTEVVLRVRSIAHLEAGMVLRACIRGEMGWTYDGRLPRTLGERQLYFPPKPAASTQRKR